jgi:hypothetical protein
VRSPLITATFVAAPRFVFYTPAESEGSVLGQLRRDVYRDWKGSLANEQSAA